MNIPLADLRSATARGIITKEQFEKFEQEAELRQSRGTRSRFDLAHSALYIGALIVISAMIWFNMNRWTKFDSTGVTVVSGALMFLFMLLGMLVWHGLHDKVPGGLFFTLAVCFVPLVIYGILKSTGRFETQFNVFGGKNYYPELNENFLYMEIATILCGLVTLLFVKFPLLTAPLAIAFWFLCMDAGAMVYQKALFLWTDNWKEISLLAGGVMLLAAYFLDRKTKEDFSAWLYFFGLAAAWTALTFWGSAATLGAEYTHFEYCLINLAIMAVAIFLHRRAFIFFGGLGILIYLTHLAWTEYKDSVGFAFTLIAIGMAAMFLGTLCYHNRKPIRAWFQERTPGFVLWLQPERARS